MCRIYKAFAEPNLTYDLLVNYRIPSLRIKSDLVDTNECIYDPGCEEAPWFDHVE